MVIGRVRAHSRVLITAFAVIVVAAQIYYVLLPLHSSPPLIWQDSIAYKTLSQVRLSTIFSQSRPPVYPLLLRWVSNDRTLVVLQGGFSILGFDVLAAVVARRVRGGALRYLIGAAIALMAVVQPVSLWNYSILTESFTISANAFALAAWVALKDRWAIVPALGLVCAFAVFLRDAEILVFGLLAGAVVVVAVIGRSRQWPQYVAAALVLALSIGAFALESQTKRGAVYLRDVFAVRIFPFPDRVAFFSAHGMPDGTLIDALAVATPIVGGQAKVVSYDRGSPKFRSLNRWFFVSGTGTYAEFLLLHPSYLIFEPFASPPQVFNNASGSVRFYAPAHQRVSRLIDDLLFPRGVILAIAALWLGAAIASRDKTDRLAWYRSMVLLLMSGIVTLAVWHAEGQEAARHTLESNLLGRIAVIMALAALAGPAAAPAEELAT